MKIWILVFIGGGIGSVCRYLISRYVTVNFFTGFPFIGTFLVNITGCFLIGFLVLYFAEARFGPASTTWRLLLVSGLCGGFTTFSTFSFENIELIESHRVLTFLAYTFASFLFGFLATYTGILLARNI